MKWVESYLRVEPNDAVAREVCLKLHGNRGNSFSVLGKHRESAEDWARVVELSNPPVPAAYRVRLAIERIASDDLARALVQAEIVPPAPRIIGEDCYNLACIFSRSASAIRNDQSIASDQRAKREAHIANALRWLKAAAEAGFFRDPVIRDHAKKDPDLAILRDRPEFRQLVEPSGAKP